MTLKDVLELFELLDSPSANGRAVVDHLLRLGDVEAVSETVAGERGETDQLRILIPGRRGKKHGGDAPTLGVVGRLGGLGARPGSIGFVSDGDGALAVLAAAATLVRSAGRGDVLDGDVIITTHVDPDAPTTPHLPVPYMGSALDVETTNRYQVDPAMDAVLAVDTTKGNRLCNHRGIAITPAVSRGWLLRVPESLLDIYERVTGIPPVVLALTMQDITPYGNGVFHLNSILQPAIATTAPVVGLAITTVTAVPGSATGATDPMSVAAAARFVVETAKDFTRGAAPFIDAEELERLVQLYGTMTRIQGRAAAS